MLVNVIMAGMSGSDLADAAATGRLLIPAMQRSGYPVGYAASLIAGAATIGPLIPPSIAFILFAAATVLGGAIPGAMLGLFLMVQAYFVAKRNNYPREARVPYGERVKVTIIGLPVLAIPFVVLGSILVGIATPTEAAVLGAIAVIVVGGFSSASPPSPAKPFRRCARSAPSSSSSPRRPSLAGCSRSTGLPMRSPSG